MAGGHNRPGQFGGGHVGGQQPHPQQGYAQPQQPQGYGPPPPAYAQAPQGYAPPPHGFHQPGEIWEPPFDHLKERSIGMCILLTIVTFGIYAYVWIYKVHNELPRRSQIDDTPGKAVGFMFIPIFSIYWVCRIYSRLTDRLNLLSAAAGQNPQPISRGLLIAALVLIFIPYINFIGLIVMLIWWVKVQETMNVLARINAQRQAQAQYQPPQR